MCSTYYILLISGTLRFCSDVTDTSQFQYRTCRATCNDTSTFCRRHQQYACTAVLTCNFMIYTVNIVSFYINDIFDSIFFTLTDCVRNFASFTNTTRLRDRYRRLQQPMQRNLIVRPPLTTFVTRLIVTTLSFKSKVLRSILVFNVISSLP